MSCCCHFDTTKSAVLQALTETTYNTIELYSSQWKIFDKEPEKSLCQALSLSVTLDNYQDFLIHKSCYARITHKAKLQRAKKSHLKRSQSQPTFEDHADCSNREAPQSKRLRSSANIKSTNINPILPKVCVICGKGMRYFYEKGQTNRDKLSHALTLNAGKLKEAAERKEDQNVLVHFITDAVASEMCYHSKCYIEYVRLVYRLTATDKSAEVVEDIEQLHPVFCKEVIASRLISNREYIPLTTLLNLHSTYSDAIKRTSKLKKLLEEKYPDLVFDQPKQRNESQLVYPKTASFTELSAFENNSPSNSDSDDKSPMSMKLKNSHTYSALFHSGMEIRHAIDSHEYIPTWPPSSQTLTMQNCEKAVPPLLYNFIALVCGRTEELPNDLEFAKTSSSVHSRLLSICQDLVYIRFNGHTPTPKSVALAMTMKHLTGSASVVKLLSSFGHCCSYDTVNRVETAIATDLLENPVALPPGFRKSVPTVLVYDNIDFTEETLSGSGSTHHVNGIMYQQGCYSGSFSDVHLQQSTSISRRKKSIAPPSLLLQPYILGKRKGIPLSESTIGNLKYRECKTQLAQNMRNEFIYLVIKYESTILKPSWTGFHKDQTQLEDLLPKSALHYLNVIEAPPNDMATISHILSDCVEKADTLELDSMVVVFDQALYSKAQQIRWKDPILQQRLVIRLGEFHTCMSFLGTIGKMFKLSGLEDLLIESGVVAGGSINGVMNGHMYNRSIRSHKILYESLGRMQLEFFLVNAGETLRDEYETKVKPCLSSLQAAQNKEVSEFYTKYQKCINTQSAKYPTFALWDSYLQLVQTLLMFVKATRQSDWVTHLHSLRLMLPFFFAMDRQNYARYGSAYWVEMTRLPSSHPALFTDMCERGSWTVQRKDHEPFCSIAGDQAIEQTVNRDSKTSGGLKGITLNRGAVQRWYLTQSERAAISRECEGMVYMNTSEGGSKELSDSRMRAHETAVKDVMKTAESFINPWSYEGDQLVSLVSGVIASQKTTDNLLSAQQIGDAAVEDFITNRIISDKVDFFAPIKSTRLSTFHQIQRKKTTQQAKVEIQSSDRSLFARLLVVSRSRKINLEEILTYPLSSVSLPLATADGRMAKNVKSQLLEAIEADCDGCLIDLLGNKGNAIVVDAMAMIQCLPTGSIPVTFGLMAEALLSQLCSLSRTHNAKRIDFVIDQYWDKSIKEAERQKRSDYRHIDKSQHLHIANGDVKVPNKWKSFLSSGGNKKNLLRFLYTYWQQCKISTHLQLFMTSENGCKELIFTPNQVPSTTDIQDLASDHEEADTRLIAHAIHASQSFSTVAISSPDTDVAILAIGHIQSFQCESVAFLTGTKSRRRILDIKAVAGKLGAEMSCALIGLHAFTGCDAVSSFSGKGKKTVYQLLKKHDVCKKAMSRLGESFKVDECLTKLCEEFTCRLYGDNGTSINKVRFTAFISRAGATQLMPPCLDSLKQHIQRANYMAAIWKSANAAMITAPSPVEHGWLEEDGTYTVMWHSGNVAPPNILKTIFCSCKKSQCKDGRCSCSEAGLKCTELCHCVSCENTVSEESDELCDDSDDEDEN